MLGFLKNLFGGTSVDYKALVKEGAIIIDVRTPMEFKGGHVKGSQNIPLDRIASQADSIAKKGKTVITVCRSGGRSAQAAGILKSKGVKVFNGGPWGNVERAIR